MPDPQAYLSSREASRFLADDTASVSLSFARHAAPALLWRRAGALSDAALLHHYALHVVDADAAHAAATGWADRYGGHGISENGGSGRAAVIADAYVKGVGRTPLIGNLTDTPATSGICYLEEGAREAVFGELFAAELPHGAVSPFALIDTGEPLHDAYDLPAGYIRRRIQVVRDVAVRPAHFERAALHVSTEPFCGERDERRVACNLEKAITRWGARGFLRLYLRLWTRWAEQMAYQYVHRLTQSLPAPSNIAFDGRLLDFGAARAVPDWGAHVHGPGLSPSGTEFTQLLGFAQQAVEDVFRRLMPEENLPDAQAVAHSEITGAFNRAFGRESLRLLGFRRETVDRWLTVPANRQRIDHALMRYLAHAQKHFSYDVEWPADMFRWDLAQAWSAEPPRHLSAMREVLLDVGRTVSAAEPVASRGAFRMRSRPMLSFDAFRGAMLERLGPDFGGRPDRTMRFSRFVEGAIVDNRRDSIVEPDALVPLGFARSADHSYALFRDDDGRTFCACETFGDSTPIAVVKLDSGHVALADGRVVEAQVGRI